MALFRLLSCLCVTTMDSTTTRRSGVWLLLKGRPVLSSMNTPLCMRGWRSVTGVMADLIQLETASGWMEGFAVVKLPVNQLPSHGGQPAVPGQRWLQALGPEHGGAGLWPPMGMSSRPTIGQRLPFRRATPVFSALSWWLMWWSLPAGTAARGLMYSC